jgi:uncharacterized protein (TIGR02996 family)
MSERSAFISAILDTWDDDAPRLVFADWLQEHGESERAEFIRAQIEAADLPEANRQNSKPARRAEALESAHGAGWRKALGLRQHNGTFVRGFLSGVDFFTSQKPSQFRRALTVEPAALTLQLKAWHENDTDVTTEEVDAIAASRVLRAVRRIERDRAGFGVEWFTRLMRAPHLVNLRVLKIRQVGLGVEGARAIADAPAPFVLESLELNQALRPGGDRPTTAGEAVQVLATSPRFSALKFLGLSSNGLGDASVGALLASKTLPETMRLVLAGNEYEEARFREQLVKRFRFGSDGANEPV